MPITMTWPRVPVAIIASLVVAAALLLFSRWRYLRSAGPDSPPPYADSFFLLSRLRSRVWPSERRLPAIGLYVVMAVCFVAALRFARLYFAWPHLRVAVWGACWFGAATVALALRQPWGWWLLAAQTLAALGVFIVRAVHMGTFDLPGILLGALYALFLLYLMRRREEFGVKRPSSPLAAPSN
jgi:hypothetical protein